MVIIIGICGTSGSGKTTLTKELGRALSATTICWDDYDAISKGPQDYVQWYQTSRDYNEWEYDALVEVLQALKQGKEVVCPATGRTIKPTSYVIFDAPLGYSHEATGEYIDFLFFLDTPADISLARRLFRDFSSEEKVFANTVREELSHYLGAARPVYLLSYENKLHCDAILDGSLSVEKLVSQVAVSIKEFEESKLHETSARI